MPSLTEKLDSREWSTGDKPTVTFHYLLAGVSDDLTAKTLLTNSTPSTYDGLVRESIQFEPVWVDTAAGDGLWDVRVRYVPAEKKEPEVGDPLKISAGTFNTFVDAARDFQQRQRAQVQTPHRRRHRRHAGRPGSRLPRGEDPAREARGRCRQGDPG